MSKKIPSQDFSYNFEIVFDKEKETEIQKAKRWIRKQKPPLNTILEYLFSYVEKWYMKWKIEETMKDVDRQAEEIVKQWEQEDEQPKPQTMETGVFGEEGWSISISNPVVERRSDKSESGLGTSSNDVRLQKDIPDPWE